MKKYILITTLVASFLSLVTMVTLIISLQSALVNFNGLGFDNIIRFFVAVVSFVIARQMYKYLKKRVLSYYIKNDPNSFREFMNNDKSQDE